MNRRLWLVVALACTHGVQALACGPYFSDPHLASVGRHLADAPRARFDGEVNAWRQRQYSPYRAIRLRTTEADSSDLSAALNGHPQHASLVRTYLKARTSSTPALPTEIPSEFARYHVAIAQSEDPAQTIAGLESLLELRADQRRFRSIWAAYMLASFADKPSDQHRWLERVRALADDGFVDSLGLAAASLRRQADVSMGQGEPADALAYCADYLASGGGWGCAKQLRTAIDAVIADPEQLDRAATSLRTAELVTLRLASSSSHNMEVQRWFRAVSNAGHAPALAGRLAWLAYRSDDRAYAERFVQMARPDDGAAHWIGGKLALEDGDLNRAAVLLERSLALVNAPHSPRHIGCSHHRSQAERALSVELGIVYVAQDRPVLAMNRFLDAGDWMDAAWVGERLLTLDELRGVVEQVAPDPILTETVESEYYGLSGYLPTILHGEDVDAALIPGLLRGVLGRRLVREGHLAEARPYLAVEARPHLDQVRADLATGDDETQSNTARGQALWRLAFTMKMQGWALSATEMGPDFRALGGWYEGLDTVQLRTDASGPGVRAPTAGERSRLVESGRPSERYHFVWTSTDLAFEAMELLPDGHVDLAQAACVTQWWMRNRDPERALEAERILQRRVLYNDATPQSIKDYAWFGLGEDGTCGTPPADGGCGAGCGTTPVHWGWSILALAVVFRRRRSA